MRGADDVSGFRLRRFLRRPGRSRPGDDVTGRVGGPLDPDAAIDQARDRESAELPDLISPADEPSEESAAIIELDAVGAAAVDLAREAAESEAPGLVI